MTDVVKRELDMKRRQAEKRATLPQERRSKYRAVKTVVDGVTFASKAEARRYVELKLREKAGEIRQLRWQVAFQLSVAPKYVPVGASTAVGKYIADFVYEELLDQDWCVRIEDVKGFRTPLYRWKKKHFEAQYGIVIREIK